MTRTRALAVELHVGTERMFASAGYREVARPAKRCLVMRIDFP